MSASGNDNLRDEIVKHCLGRLGLPGTSATGSTFDLASERFLIEKRIAFAEEDRQYQNKVFGAEDTIDKSRVQLLLGDTGDEICSEWTLIFRLADARPFAFQWSRDEEEWTNACFEQNGVWHPAGIPMLAKILNGFENLHMRSFVLRWQKIADWTEIYGALITFLKSQ